MAMQPRTPADMNRLNAARAAGLVMPGGGERQEELASLPGQTPATPQNIPQGFTLADIQRMMSDPSRYGKINAPAKQQAAAPTKSSKGGPRGTPKAPPKTPGTPKTPTGPMQTVELPEPGLNSPWLPSLLMGGAGAGAAALAKYLLSRKGGASAPVGGVGEEDIARAVTGAAGGADAIQEGEWSLAKDLPPVPKRLAPPGPGDAVRTGPPPIAPPPLTDVQGRPLPMDANGWPKGTESFAAPGSTQDLIKQVIAESGIKPVATPPVEKQPSTAPKKKRTPKGVELEGGRRRLRTPDVPSGRVGERFRAPKGIKVKP